MGSKPTTIFLSFILALLVIIAGAMYFPAGYNYFTGNSVVVDYRWTGPNSVTISSNYNSAIPAGYDLYVYRVEPTHRDETSYGVPVSSEWKFTDYTSGFFDGVTITVNHAEIMQAICVKTGSDPLTAFHDDGAPNFDTARTHNFAFEIDCN